MLSYQGFFGTPRDVAKLLYDLPKIVVAGPYYALLLESGAGADIRVFVRERPEDTHGAVRDWTGDRFDDLPERILRACWDGQGEPEQVADVLDGFAEYEVRTGLMCPPTARGAFGHQMRRHEPQPHVRAFVVS